MISEYDVEGVLSVIDERHDFEEDLLQVEIRPDFEAQKRLQEQQTGRKNVHFGRCGET